MSEQAAIQGRPALQPRRDTRRRARATLPAARKVQLAAGAVVLLYVLVFVRGLGWQWQGIITATRVAPPAESGPRP